MLSTNVSPPPKKPPKVVTRFFSFLFFFFYLFAKEEVLSSFSIFARLVSQLTADIASLLTLRLHETAPSAPRGTTGLVGASALRRSEPAREPAPGANSKTQDATCSTSRPLRSTNPQYAMRGPDADGGGKTFRQPRVRVPECGSSRYSNGNVSLTE